MDNPKSNQPDSGTYGEKAALNSLKESLPGGVIGQPLPPAPAGGPPPMSPQPINPADATRGRPPTGSAVPQGIPSAIAMPTQQPNVPANTPLSQPVDPMAGIATPSQGRIALLQMLSQSPDVSSTTQAWAQELLRLLLGGQGQVLSGG